MKKFPVVGSQTSLFYLIRPRCSHCNSWTLTSSAFVQEFNWNSDVDLHSACSNALNRQQLPMAFGIKSLKKKKAKAIVNVNVNRVLEAMKEMR